jgi:hypothetical protein
LAEQYEIRVQFDAGPFATATPQPTVIHKAELSGPGAIVLPE